VARVAVVALAPVVPGRERVAQAQVQVQQVQVLALLAQVLALALAPVLAVRTARP
jgi:hypothetical protein